MIPAEKIDEIIEKLDIVEVISKFVQLKKSGKSYKGLCPFHPEKTPSFFVSTEKQIFHCFGCGTGGNVITFLMKMENLSFNEAAMVAAEMAGVEIPKTRFSSEIDSKKKEIFETNKIAMDFFKNMLESKYGSQAIDYLEKRGISHDYREKFGFGYAPAGNKLVEYVKEKKLSIERFEQAGLITKKENEYVDLFKNRIIMPIFDHRNNIAGFGARAIEESQQPKYLNTPENYVFKKGNLFYGLNWAKEKIKNVDFAIIVEGYFDLIKMHIAGFENTIAPLGTALTENHMRLLKRWTNKILLVFDSDSAGTSAAFRSLETILSEGCEVKIGVMPSGFDPDEFLDNYGTEALKKLLNQSKDFVDFAFGVAGQKYALDTPKGIADLIDELLRLIKKIPDEIEMSIRTKQVAKLTGVDETILNRKLSEIQELKTSSSDREIKEYKPVVSASEYAEKILIGILLQQPAWADEIKQFIELFPESVKLAINCCLNNSEVSSTIQKLLNRINDNHQAGLLTKVLMDENNETPLELKKKEFYDCAMALCRKFYENRVMELKKIIKQKTETGQSYERELEELHHCIQQTTIKNFERFQQNFERRANGKQE
jgi:DNA primase